MQFAIFVFLVTNQPSQAPSLGTGVALLANRMSVFFYGRIKIANHQTAFDKLGVYVFNINWGSPLARTVGAVVLMRIDAFTRLTTIYINTVQF